MLGNTNILNKIIKSILQNQVYLNRKASRHRRIAWFAKNIGACKISWFIPISVVTCADDFITSTATFLLVVARVFLSHVHSPALCIAFAKNLGAATIALMRSVPVITGAVELVTLVAAFFLVVTRANQSVIPDFISIRIRFYNSSIIQLK